MDQPGMIIVGAGEAGARAASSLRERGYGGSVTLVGEETHGPYERPPLSKRFMTEDALGYPAMVLDEAKLAAQDIVHLSGVRATRIDGRAHVLHLADGRALAYARLLIATGAGPRQLPTPGAGRDNVLYLRSFADALKLRERLRPDRHLVVIGGGFIGLEIAAGAVTRGCSVTLIEMASRILMRGVPPEVADAVLARHLRAGVVFRLGVGITRIERNGTEEVVVLADGSAVTCDAIIAGIGAMPETDLAQASGLALENGVKADERLRTSEPDVFAAGDCCSFPHPLYDGRRLRLEAWRNAQDQGSLAAANMLGGEEIFAAVPWFWSDQYDQTLQVAGLIEAASTTVQRPLGEGTLYFHLAADGRLVGASGIGPNSVIAKDMRLAEMLITRRAKPDAAALASASVKLKALL